MARLVALVLVLAAGLGVLLLAARRGRLLAALALSLGALASAWAASLAAVATDWRDADGFVDCWPSCSLAQDAVGATLLGAPAVAALLLAAAGLVAWSRRVDARRGGERSSLRWRSRS